MKRRLFLLVLLSILVSLLAGCAGELPELPPLPGKETPDAAEEPVIEAVAETPVPTPAAVQELSLSVTLPASGQEGEETVWYFSPAEEFDCAFSYPSYCRVWVEKGALRLDPVWCFARMFFTSVRKDAEGAPEEMTELLQPGKWGVSPAEGTAGSGWSALRMLHLKYDTWRRWIAWETPERYYLLYGSCFDGREDVPGSVFETIAASFLTNEELIHPVPAYGEALYQADSLTLSCAGAQIRSGEEGLFFELRLSAGNSGDEPCAFSVSALEADGNPIPFDEHFSVNGHEGGLWLLPLPLTAEGGDLAEELSFSVTADAADASAALPVSIHITR